jgi:general secretion pathway protein E
MNATGADDEGRLAAEATAALTGAEAAPDDELKRLADELGLPWSDTVDLKRIDKEVVVKTPFHYARSRLILPLREEGGRVVAVTARPEEAQSADDLRLIYGMPVSLTVASGEAVSAAINSAYDLSAHSASDVIDDIALKEGALDELVHGLPEDLLDTSAEAPVIRLVNSVLVEAAKEKASDIHIEPYERELKVRFRIDGVLRDVVKPPKKLQPVIVSRVKIMAGLDIAEKRLPQDGRIKIVIAGKEIDVRVSTIPTSHGERVVMRLLDKSSMLLGFDQIGMSGAMRDQMGKLIKSPHGIVLVSGPTGAGKTTTLYAALTYINQPELNIITVEDPVEYQLAGVGQVQVQSKIGLTFAAGLRSILRQDPDVIMIGEIRDAETAQIAVQASLTGHLVFSTIHTNDAAGAVTRLTDMGIEPFLIASSLIGTVAQRLVRTLCKECRRGRPATEDDLLQLGLTPVDLDRFSLREKLAGSVVHHPVGCEVCRNSGYKGRTGLYELLLMDDEIRSHVVRNADAAAIRKAAIARGMVPMRVAGAQAVLAGTTSMEEVVRVTADA